MWAEQATARVGPDGAHDLVADASLAWVRQPGRHTVDLGIMLKAYPTEEDTIRGHAGLLLDGRWFTVGVRADLAASDTSPVPDGAEVDDLGDRIYYVVERPADAAMVPAGDLWSTVRPTH